jgi:YD repeat-containing protein
MATLHKFQYTYDKAGNRTWENKDGTSVYYYYDAANQLTERNVVGTGWTYYEYDANGSMVTEQAPSGNTYFEYADNGLVSKIVPSTGDPLEFAYDARMQRYWANWGASQSYFQWDGLNQIIEKDGDLNTVAQHTHGAVPVAGIGSVVETERSTGTQYPSYDSRGSLHDLEDASVGNLDAEYNAFGEELTRTGNAVTRFGYQGTAWTVMTVGSTIVYLSPTRIYFPDCGRFVQRDLATTFTSQIGIKFTNMSSVTPEKYEVNQLRSQEARPWYSYLFESNNPANAADPSGLMYVNVGEKTYDFDTSTGTIKVLKKNGVLQTIPAGGPTAQTVTNAAQKLQEQYGNINAEQVKELYKCIPEGAPGDSVVAKLRDPEVAKLTGLSLLEKVGLVASVVSAGGQIAVTIEDPTLKNLAKSGFATANAVAGVGKALANNFLSRLVLPVAVVNAVFNDIPTIYKFAKESYGLADDAAAALTSTIDARMAEAKYNSEHLDKVVDRLLDRQLSTGQSVTGALY